MAGSGSQIIHVHRDAPLKPAFGAPCNGCGVCCAAATCPLGLIVFRRRSGPCPALEWHEGDHRYRCRLLAAASRRLRPLIARWIAAGTSCDSHAEGD